MRRRVSPVIFARIGCALEFRSCRYFGSRSAEYVAWVRLGRRIMLLFACPRPGLASSIFTFWQPFNFCIIFFIKTYRFSLFWASVCVGLLAGRLAWLAGFPPGWLAGWLGHLHRRHFYPGWAIARIGCALEFRSRRYFGSRGAEYVAWVRLGRWILCAGACPR